MEILKEQAAWGQPGLSGEFQASQSYRDCILNKNKCPPVSAHTGTCEWELKCEKEHTHTPAHTWEIHMPVHGSHHSGISRVKQEGQQLVKMPFVTIVMYIFAYMCTKSMGKYKV